MSLFHSHDWRISALDHGRERPIAAPSHIKGTVVTLVLYHCDGCGKSMTRTIDGHWTRAEIEGRA